MGEANLHLVWGRRNLNEGDYHTYKFDDGMELLSLNIISSRIESNEFYVPPGIDDAQFDFLRLDKLGELSTEEYKRLREQYPILQLDHTLGTHQIGRGKTYESKIKNNDLGALAALSFLASISENYGITDQVNVIGNIIPGSVAQNKSQRTHSLLNDFNSCLASLQDVPVWLRIKPHVGNWKMAAQLEGFTISGEGLDTAIEPLVRGMDGTVGLLPESMYIESTVNIRVDPNNPDC